MSKISLAYPIEFAQRALAAFIITFPTVLHADNFDYNSKSDTFYVKGWIESQYSFTCGFATREHISDAGYISLYEHAYWLIGQPHKTWNFEVQTTIPEAAPVWVDILIDGNFFTRYPQQMKVETQSVSSSSDVCDDHLGGYCPDRSTVATLNDLVSKITGAKTLTFNLFDGSKTETHNLDVSNFAKTRLAIEACLGNLATRVPRH